MAKQLLKIVMKAANVAKNARGANIQFAVVKDLAQTPQGQTQAREVAVINILDQSLADKISTMDAQQKGKDYEIIINEL